MYLAFQRASSHRSPLFVYATILLLFIYLVHPEGIVAEDPGKNADPEIRSVFLLPKEIIGSFFPIGEKYQIPTDKRIAPIIERAAKFEEKGTVSQAYKYYFFAYRRVEDEKKAPYILFKLCYLAESIEKAVASLEEIIEKYPSFPLLDAVRFELATQRYLKNEYDSASAALKEVIESESDAALIFTPYAYEFWGILSYESGEHEKAIQYHTKAMNNLVGETSEHRDSRAVFYIRNYIGISQNLIALKRYDEADDLLKRIIKTSELPLFHQQALFLLAHNYGSAEETLLAYSAYSQLIEQFPASVYRLNAERQREKLAFEQEPETAIEITGIYDESILLGKYGEGPLKKHQPEGSMRESGSDKATDRYMVQVGSFSREGNAKNLVDLLMKKGFTAFSVRAVVSDQVMFRVRVGYFPTLQEAERVRQTLIESGYEGFVVKEK